MRVWHAAVIGRSSPGIQVQMAYEQEAAEELALDWTCKLFAPQPIEKSDAHVRGGVPSRLAMWFAMKVKGHWTIWNHRNEIDILLLRYSPADPVFLLFLLLYRKPIVLVHHTHSVGELAVQGRLGRLRSRLEKLQLPFAERLAQASAAVTPEVADEVRRSRKRPNSAVMIYPNGVRITQPPVDDCRSAVPTILFMASHFAPWHGLDLLLQQLPAEQGDFVLHVVGQVPADLIARIDDSRVKVHGQLDPRRYRAVASECCLAIDTLALDRIGMRQACTLKSREYLSLGLPVVSDHIDIFPPDFPYYIQVEPQLGRIVEVARQVIAVDREEVVEACRIHIDKRHLLASFHDEIVGFFTRSQSRPWQGRHV